jgi:hypothetical protein
VKRVATANPLQGEPRSFEGPILFNRFEGIFGTSGKKPAAVADKRADRSLIETNQK